jgi:cytoskeletal protein CcmA (bactofilin family)
MFRNKKRKIDPDTTDTLIGEGTVFEGKIRSEAGIRVEGRIIGDIECAGDVTVGEKGVLYSNISARHVELAGTVHGNVTAQGQLTIRSSGRLYGNLTAQRLNIEAGAVFQGSSKMTGGEQPEQSAAPAEPAASEGNAAQLAQGGNQTDHVLKAW